MDPLQLVYDQLINDPYIREQAYGRIKYYEFPETSEVSSPFIIIDPLDVPLPKDYADNTWLTYDCLYQIDVWSKNRTITRNISNQIRAAMWKIGFFQGTGVDEWDKDKGIFRDARRYRGKLYKND